MVVLFDIDGVLVDVRPSYYRVIVKTVGFYLREILGFPVTDDVVSEAHVVAVKRMGGFNNDWNSVVALLQTLLAAFPPAPPLTGSGVDALREAARPLTRLPDAEERLRAAAQHFLRIEPLVRERGGGLAGVLDVVGTRNHHLIQSGSWNPEDDLVVRIYQEIYLGPELFLREYGTPARFYTGHGLIDDEVRIISVETVALLCRHHLLGLVTGRPRMEAEYALKHLGLWPYFRVLVSLDEVRAEMKRRGTDEFLGKPHPWSLLEAARILDPSGKERVVFVGDTNDDMRAAVAARPSRSTLAVGCAYVYEDPAEAVPHLREAGADLIIYHPDEILSVL